MCEILANALPNEDFPALLDGCSMNTSDPAQPPLGADCDSGPITGFDERDLAALKFMEMASDTAARETYRYLWADVLRFPRDHLHGRCVRESVQVRSVR